MRREFQNHLKLPLYSDFLQFKAKGLGGKGKCWEKCKRIIIDNHEIH